MSSYLVKENTLYTTQRFIDEEKVSEKTETSEREDNYQLKAKKKILDDYLWNRMFLNWRIEVENKETRQTIKLRDMDHYKEWLKQSMKEIEKWNYVLVNESRKITTGKNAQWKCITRKVITIERV